MRHLVNAIYDGCCAEARLHVRSGSRLNIIATVMDAMRKVDYEYTYVMEDSMKNKTRPRSVAHRTAPS